MILKIFVILIKFNKLHLEIQIEILKFLDRIKTLCKLNLIQVNRSQEKVFNQIEIYKVGKDKFILFRNQKINLWAKPQHKTIKNSRVKCTQQTNGTNQLSKTIKIIFKIMNQYSKKRNLETRKPFHKIFKIQSQNNLCHSNCLHQSPDPEI